MKLPRFESARIAPAKIAGYLLDTSHPKGGAKARFLMRFGFDPDLPDVLRQALLDHCAANEVETTEHDRFGIRYRIRGPLVSPDGRNPEVLTVWAILSGETYPQFVTLVPEHR